MTQPVQDVHLSSTPEDQRFMDHLAHVFARPDRAHVYMDNNGHVTVGCDDGEVEFAFVLVDVRNVD
jgi:hypothetical protein